MTAKIRQYFPLQIGEEGGEKRREGGEREKERRREANVRFPDVIIVILANSNNVRATEKERISTVRRPKERTMR